MEEFPKITKEILAEIDEKEITWQSEMNKTKIPCKILADIEIGISVKPIISIKEIVKLTSIWPYPISIEEASEPDFCLISITEKGINKNKETNKKIMELIECVRNGTYLYESDNCVTLKPSCPFA